MARLSKYPTYRVADGQSPLFADGLLCERWLHLAERIKAYKRYTHWIICCNQLGQTFRNFSISHWYLSWVRYLCLAKCLQGEDSQEIQNSHCAFHGQHKRCKAGADKDVHHGIQEGHPEDSVSIVFIFSGVVRPQGVVSSWRCHF